MSYIKKRLGLFKDPSFNFLSIETLLGALSVGITYVALSWHILSIENSINSIVILMATWWLPGPLLGPIGGYLADRFSKKKILLVSQIINIVILIFFLAIPGAMYSLIPIFTYTLFRGITYGVSFPANIVLTREIMALTTRSPKRLLSRHF